MAQPTPYNKGTNYTAYATAHSSAPFPPAALDSDLANVELTLDQTLVNLAMLQRDDGQLANLIVTPDTLAPSTLELLAVAVNPRGAWLTATVYAKSDTVSQSGNTYMCSVAHTSGTFATDLAAGKWLTIYSTTTPPVTSVFTRTGAVVAAASDYDASQVDNDSAVAGSKVSDALNTLNTATNALVFGQCRLARTSTTLLTLSPLNGNKLFINGQWRALPAAGVTLSNALALIEGGAPAINTTYNIYAQWDGAAIVLKASATARATDATYGHQIRSGDATSVLVGKAFYNAAGQFAADTEVLGGVLSWYNRSRKFAVKAFTANRTTSATVGAEINSEIRLSFLSWGDEVAEFKANGSNFNSTTVTGYTYIGINGIALTDSGGALYGTNNGHVACDYAVNAGEGLSYATLGGFVASASTHTWTGGGNGGGQRTTLSGVING